MKPLVSILIPAFNAQRWIGDTIHSALGQRWPNKEVILVDDGSSDSTLSIAKKFECEVLKVVTQSNAGAAAARNRALAECQGNYIQWLDADDLLAPDKISSQMAVLSNLSDQQTLLSSAWGHFIYRPRRTKFSPTPLWRDLAPIDWLLTNLAEDYWMQTSTWLVSRELTEAAGPWDVRLLGDDDGEYFCRVIVASSGIRFVPEAKVFYRRSPGSLSYVGRSSRKLEAHFLSMQLRIGHVLSLEDSERVRAACLNYLQTYVIYFYPDMGQLLTQADELATSLGGRLEVPKLPWKYAWIQKLLGWDAAKLAQFYYNRIKSSAIRSYDHALFQLGL